MIEKLRAIWEAMEADQLRHHAERAVRGRGVSDEHEVRREVARILREQGYEVTR